MKKVRVFELARAFGMKGPALAKLLKSMGFANVKTHMTALDEADEMMVVARLEAHGHKRLPPEEQATPPPSRRKKLPLPGDGDAGAELAPATEAKPKRKKLPGQSVTKKQLPKPVGGRPRKSLQDVAAGVEPATEPVATTATETAPETVEVTAEPTEAAEATAVEAPEEVVEAATADAPVIEEVAETPADDAGAGATETETATPAAAAAASAETEAPAEPETQPAAASAEEAPPAAAEDQDPGAPPPAGGIDPTDPDASVRKLLLPQKKATVVGRIELPQETIRDATRRSAPAGSRDLRRAALQKTSARSAIRSPMQGHRRGPVRGGRGGRDAGPRGHKKARPAPTIDPSKEVVVTPPVS
ncbi:MAG: translation initiation factor IF-2 N-terminal domain-containing protein, partial [Planctomycetota bacterium]|nr:translation initiation factor IF-2 N-terminal domain-containing protein [Planctomycetota bacterium]